MQTVRFRMLLTTLHSCSPAFNPALNRRFACNFFSGERFISGAFEANRQRLTELALQHEPAECQKSCGVSGGQGALALSTGGDSAKKVRDQGEVDRPQQPSPDAITL